MITIKTVVRFQNNLVVVFDKKGEQIPKYQGRYEDVKGHILKDALPETVFTHWPDYETDIRMVSREEW